MKTGIAIIITAIITPLYWFLPLAAEKDSIAILSQYIGSTAIISMGISQFLAARLTWTQAIFGGLDRVYILHKWIGIGTMIAVLLHDTIDAELRGVNETVLTEFAETLGELSLYGFLVLVIISITTFIPYHMWRWTHRFMGTFFAFSSFHYLFITKPFSVWEPVGLYISAFCLLGIVSYCYTLVPFSILQGRHKYKVSSAEQNGEGLSVTLQPVGRGLRHLPGQFAFVRFDGLGQNEVHPFTISKAPGSGNQIRFTIKPLGDDTQSLVREISTGQTAIVSNAFGHFTRRNNGNTEIWIAGGIGITPFVAFAEDLKSATGTVHLFYSVSDRKRAAHLRELEEIAAQRDGFNLHLVETDNQGRLDIAKLEEAMGSVPVDTVVYFCGPEEMRESLQKEFIAKNIPARRFRYEEFRIRSGIDYFAFFSWLLRRLWLQVEKVQK